MSTAVVLLTRFNLPSVGVESLIRAQEGWLRERIDLFERFTVPSVAQQSDRDLTWFVYVDPESPAWLMERLAPHVRAGLLVTIPRTHVTHDEVATDLLAHVTACDDLITANLDNDDGLAHDFVARLRISARGSRCTAVYLAEGLIRSGDLLYRRHDAHNAFCAVRERWSSTPATCWRDWHNLLHLHMPVVELRGEPAWLQVVHGRNVSNRVRGTLTRPGPFLALFGDGVADLPDPGWRLLALDRFVRTPLRAVRESVRSIGKAVLMATLGKRGLDRVKVLLSRQARTTASESVETS